MPSQAEYPFEEYKLYVVFHKKMKRRMACLVSKENRTTISYARYLMSVHLGRKLTKIETVDHIDGDTLNDSLENLQILSNEDNIKKSARGKTMVTLECPQCLTSFIRERRQTHLVKGGNATYCSRNCCYNKQRKNRLVIGSNPVGGIYTKVTEVSNKL
jgi:plasmid replication initiation protein